jgi:hypothetical protein
MLARCRPRCRPRNVVSLDAPQSRTPATCGTVPRGLVWQLTVVDSASVVLALGGDLSGGDVLVAAAVLALLLTAWQVRIAILGQQRAAQPVVVTHERRYDISNKGELEFAVWIENHGIAAAFNVRFGVELAGRRYPYALDDDSDRGARQVVGAGERVPPASEFTVRVPWTFYKGAEPNESVIPQRVFWTRYENPFGETWETLNPADPARDLQISRVRRWLLPWFEWRERRRRRADEEA